MAALDQLDAAYRAARTDPDFQAELATLQRDYTGRPSPLTRAALHRSAMVTPGFI